ncbi:hypothetical protein [Lactobacillus sp. UCMA15818]|uniref:hypothetical protein n=1 Tax=Lactobacillus sp. UCMA15818 TaxID=2583394 RepID=UPI0025AECFC3|nr:hypothetical protein [Lactobacillus sp. UCMA15818]MDN2452994.1 hypothetical protein [Lactobacillus sp. UCMA15818]
MKIKISNIYIFIIYIILTFNLGIFYFKEIPNLSLYVSSVLTVIIFVLFLIFEKKGKNIAKKRSIELIYLIVLYGYLIFQFLRSQVYSTTNIFTAMYVLLPYLYLLLVFPIKEVIARKGLIKILKNIAFYDLIATSFRFFIWYLYNYHSSSFFSILFDQNGREWTKSNGSIRLAATAFNGISFVLFAYILMNSKKMKNKLMSMLGIIILGLYACFVYMSRSQLISYFIVLLIMYFVKNIHSRSAVLSYMLMCIWLVFLFYTPFLQNFLNSFSLGSSQGSSTYARFLELQYFSGLMKEKYFGVFFGIGILNDSNSLNALKFYLSDLGIIGQYFRYGIIGIIIFCYPFIMAFSKRYLGRKSCFNLLTIGTLCYTILASFMSQSIFDNVRIIALPFLLAIIWSEKPYQAITKK